MYRTVRTAILRIGFDVKTAQRTIATIGFSIIALLAFAHCRPGDITVTAASSTTGGLTVGFRDGHIFCDSLVCPPGSAKCRVTRKNDPNDESKLKLIRKCFNSDGATTIIEEGNEMREEFKSTFTFTYIPGENPTFDSEYISSDPADDD